LRPLQPQHQLNQLFLAQTFKIAAAHTSRESANPSWRKGLGNYRRRLKLKEVLPNSLSVESVAHLNHLSMSGMVFSLTDCSFWRGNCSS
jgi:hypothetical protein